MDIIMKNGQIAELKDLPDYSISIDGFVRGPELDIKHHRFSFDHHSSPTNNCIRLITNAACKQVWSALMLGLNPSDFTIFCNHADIDVALSIWLLKNVDRCPEILVKKLVDIVNLADMFGSAINLNGNSKIVEWLAAPETDSRRAGDYYKLSDTGLLTVIESIEHRIDLYVNGEASMEIIKQHPPGTYKILLNEETWVMVESQDPHIYSQLYNAGFTRILLVRPQSDGTYAYSLAKKSDFISGFDLPEIFAQLNLLEPGWGGGSTIGGAPRNPDGSRSKLPPEKVAEVINNCILGVYKKAKKPRKTSSKK
jgi:hypothetical protein